MTLKDDEYRNIQRMNAAPKKPHLPKEDIKVIIRPKDGFKHSWIQRCPDRRLHTESNWAEA
ncbi:hypothetical protein HPB52_024566 [Rhipicephalus sanguineus]|uniref:Uncharacterized protein n=1 Tax=Rhipicephalus sanguineus TaxID=34632 RepID=A0A9D4P9B8_RHISA|nr:hypothetical protein HPB52_024566 [Rhipicephalus sanguineus]